MEEIVRDTIKLTDLYQCSKFFFEGTKVDVLYTNNTEARVLISNRNGYWGGFVLLNEIEIINSKKNRI